MQWDTLKNNNAKENTMKHSVSNSESDLRKILDEIQNNPREEVYQPTVDDFVSSEFKYDDIVHYLKFELDQHVPGQYDSYATHRIAKWCRLFLEQKY